VLKRDVKLQLTNYANTVYAIAVSVHLFVCLLQARALVKMPECKITQTVPHNSIVDLIFRSLPTDDLADWNSGVSVRPNVCPYIRSTKSFSDFHLIWFVGRPRPDMHTSVTSTRSKVKVKVTELPKLRKLHFCRSISSAVLVHSSKLMVDGDSMGPGLQLLRAQF